MSWEKVRAGEPGEAESTLEEARDGEGRENAEENRELIPGRRLRTPLAAAGPQETRGGEELSWKSLEGGGGDE